MFDKICHDFPDVTEETNITPTFSYYSAIS